MFKVIIIYIITQNTLCESQLIYLFSVFIPMNFPLEITNTQSDRELILIWIADKSRTTQASFKGMIVKFIEFIDKPLSEVRLDAPNLEEGLRGAI
jgi:hypothetical protein